MLWTSEVLLNKIMNEQQPRVVYIILQGQVVVDDTIWILQCVPFDRVGNIIARLSTVPYFPVRLSRSSTLCYGLPSCMCQNYLVGGSG